MHMQIACIHVAHRKLGKRRNVYLNAYFTHNVHVLSMNKSQLCKYCFGAGTYILRIRYCLQNKNEEFSLPQFKCECI